MTAPRVFDYENYRLFLKDYYQFKKARSGEFSYRAFARLAGFKSPNFLKLVIDGQRNLTTESLRQVIKAMKLSPEENDFFRRLVAFNQATDPADKRKYAAEVYKSEISRGLFPLRQAQLDYYQNWFYIPIRELVAHPDFREDGEWLASKLLGKISAEQGAKALRDLLSLGLLSREENGRLCLTNANVTTGSEVVSSAVADFHRQMLTRASDSIQEVPRHLREISSSTLVLSEADFARFKTLVQDFRRSLLAEAQGPSPISPSRVYHVAFQLFPVTEIIDLAPEAKCKKIA